MTKTFFIILTMVFLSQSINAQSPQEAKPSFDCAKATTRVEKMICSDSSGELQNLDKQLFESYQAIKAKLDKNDKKHCQILKNLGSRHERSANLKNA